MCTVFDKKKKLLAQKGNFYYLWEIESNTTNNSDENKTSKQTIIKFCLLWPANCSEPEACTISLIRAEINKWKKCFKTKKHQTKSLFR